MLVGRPAFGCQHIVPGGGHPVALIKMRSFDQFEIGALIGVDALTDERAGPGVELLHGDAGEQQGGGGDPTSC